VAANAGIHRDEIEADGRQHLAAPPAHSTSRRQPKQAIEEFREGVMWLHGLSQQPLDVRFRPRASEARNEYYNIEHGAIVLGSPEKVIADTAGVQQTRGESNNVIGWFGIGRANPQDQVPARAMRDVLGQQVMPKLDGQLTTDGLSRACRQSVSRSAALAQECRVPSESETSRWADQEPPFTRTLRALSPTAELEAGPSPVQP